MVQILTERKERELCAGALEFEREMRAQEREQFIKNLEFEREMRAEERERLSKKLEIERERSAQALLAVKAEADKRVRDFITSSSYKGLRDGVEGRNKEEESK
jgi:hypothetical protein